MQGRNRGGAPINGKGASDLKKLNNVTLKHDVDTIQDGKMEKKKDVSKERQEDTCT